MEYVAVSLPEFARLRSTDLVDPSKTALRGVISRLPCAKIPDPEKIEIPSSPAVMTEKNPDLQEWIALPEFIAFSIDIGLSFYFTR
jgi:hypothetical protein